jgi:hypothetical protein
VADTLIQAAEAPEGQKCQYCEEDPASYKVNGQWWACGGCAFTVLKGTEDAEYQVYCAIGAYRSCGEEPTETDKAFIAEETWIETVAPPNQRKDLLHALYMAWERAAGGGGGPDGEE